MTKRRHLTHRSDYARQRAKQRQDWPFCFKLLVYLWLLYWGFIVYCAYFPQNIEKLRDKINHGTTSQPISSTPEIGLSDTPPQQELVQNGKASWYDYDLKRKDQKCLDDDCWSMYHATCASRFFKKHSTVIVKNLETGKEIECYVNDYIEHPERIIDLSSFAFAQLAPLGQGLFPVEVRYK